MNHQIEMTFKIHSVKFRIPRTMAQPTLTLHEAVLWHPAT